MRFTEYLLDWIAEIPLVEMATTQQEIKRLCASQVEPISIQFCKLSYLNNPRDYNHWIDNFDGFLVTLEDCIFKHNHKRPTASQYRQWLFFEIREFTASSLDRRFSSQLKAKYSEIPLKKPWDRDEAWEALMMLFAANGKLLTDLSKGEFTTITDYWKFLDVNS